MFFHIDRDCATRFTSTPLMKPINPIDAIKTTDSTKKGHSFPNNSMSIPAVAPDIIPIPLVPTALSDIPFMALSLPTISTMKDCLAGPSKVRTMPLINISASACHSWMLPDMTRYPISKPIAEYRP